MDALERLLENGLRPRLVYVVPTHGNPRSSTMRAEKREKLLRLARTRDFYVVADEVYHLLSWGKGERAPPPRFREVEREMLSKEEGQRERDDGTGTTSSDDRSDDPYAAPAENRLLKTRLLETDDDAAIRASCRSGLSARYWHRACASVGSRRARV